jgi:hypothetical protein
MLEFSGPEVHCLVCASHLFAGLVYCFRCTTAHHRDCWEYSGSCAVYGCGETRYGASPDATPAELPVMRGVSLQALVAERAARSGTAAAPLPAFHGAADLGTLSRRALAVLLQVVRGDRAVLYFRGPRGLEPRAHRVRSGEALWEDTSGAPPAVPAACAQEVLLTGRVVHHDDLARALAQPGSSTTRRIQPHIRSLIAVPIGPAAAPDGVMYVETRLFSTVLTAADVQFAQGLATLFSLELQFMSAA